MGSVFARARSDLRRTLRSSIALILMIGIASGAVLASAAGARRTDTVWDRFRETTNGYDAVTISCPNDLPWPTVDLDQVAALPMIKDSARAYITMGYVTDEAGDPLFFDEPNTDTGVQGVVHPGDVEKFRMKLLEGRLTDPSEPNEVTVSYRRNPDPGAAVGSTLYLHSLPRDADIRSLLTGSQPVGKVFDVEIPLKVVGITLMSGPGNQISGNSADIAGTPAFFERYGDDVFACQGEFSWLVGGSADTEDYYKGVQEIEPEGVIVSARDEATYVHRNVHIAANIMWLFAALVAAAGLVIFGQALARQTSVASTENPILRALGMTRGQIFGVSLLRAVAIGLMAACVAVTIAIPTSALFPSGLGAIAEPTPGVLLDAPVVAGGVLFVVLAVVVIAAIPAWRAAKVRGDALGTAVIDEGRRPSVIAAAGTKAGFRAPAVTGIRLGLEPGRGRTAVPVRSAMIGLVLAITALTASMTFRQSFDHLLETPELAGITFDTGVGNPFTHFERNEARTYFEESPYLVNLSGGNFAQSVSVTGPDGDSNAMNVWGLDQIEGEQHPTVIDGEWPSREGEIALGSKSMRSVDVEIGDAVIVSGGEGRLEMEVVGRVVFPDFGFGPGLGEGGGMLYSELQELFPDVDQNLFLGDFAPGVDVAEATRRMNADIAKWGMEVRTGEEVTESKSLLGARRARGVPALLAGVLSLMAVAMLAHTLFSSIRRRRRDLAILKTLGFTRGQVSVAVAWQASSLLMVSLAIGLPAGIIVGRWAWNLFAEQLGVVPVAVVPFNEVLLIVPVALLIANLLALLPGRVAGRTKPSIVLRAE